MHAQHGCVQTQRSAFSSVTRSMVAQMQRQVVSKVAAEPWPPSTTAAYLLADRNWRSVEKFYAALVAGEACLSQIGLAPAGRAPHGMPERPSPPQSMPGASARQQQSAAVRTTYKLHVAYFGAAFRGWARQPGERTAEGVLSAALTAAGLTGEHPRHAAKAQRAAARAARRAHATRAAASSSPHSQQQQQEKEDEEGKQGSDDDDALPEVQPAMPEAAPPAAAVQVPAAQLHCAGRTDAGVTAAAQVVSLWSWAPPVQEGELLARIAAAVPAALEAHNSAAPGVCNEDGRRSGGCGSGGEVASPAATRDEEHVHVPLRVWRAECVPRSFHATYSAAWRRYVYLLPLRWQCGQEGPSCGGGGDDDDDDDDHEGCGTDSARQSGRLGTMAAPGSGSASKHLAAVRHNTAAEDLAVALRTPDVDVAVLNTLLSELQGAPLPLGAFARDASPSSNGVCTLMLSRATAVTLPCGQPAAAVELVGDRFLRRAVRVLVATAAREAARGADAGVLVELARAGNRAATAPPAPSLGLCFAAAGYCNKLDW